jgi:metal-dependent amidase/aminoacylase/carboxypeptidase family protein
MSANDPYLSEMFSAAHDDLDESERMRQDIFSVPELNVLAEFAESNTSHLSRQHLEQSLGVQVAAIGSQGLVDREWADFGKNRTVLLRGSVYMDFLRVNATRMRRYKITPLDKETAAGTGVEGGSPLARRA